jgi:transmembrane sensor
VSASGRQPPVDEGEPPWDLLDRYFSGTSTPDELALISAWEKSAPGRRHELEAVRAIWARSQHALGPRPVWETDRMVADLRTRMRDERRSRPPAWLSQHWPLSASAAALLAAVSTAVVISRGWLPAALSPIRDFETPPAARASVTLRDGTVLTLGPATHLRVPREFGHSTRTVELDGEALFSVVHDPRHPFVVKTARTVIRDVGTTFSVVAYAKDPGMQVAVTDGEVTVDGASLGARDVGTIGATGHLSIRHRADVRPFVAWSQGNLVFVNTPLRDVMRVLERTYDLQITVADSALGAQLITATFTNEPADMVLDDITAIVGAAYVRSARSVVIQRRPRPESHLRHASYARGASDLSY